MISYKIIKAKLIYNPDLQKVNAVIITTENGINLGVPFDPANTDYQAYLKWLADGNQPLPAENA